MHSIEVRVGNTPVAGVLDNLQVATLNPLCGRIEEPSARERNFVVSCSEGMLGTFLTIQKLANGLWSVNEVTIQHVPIVESGSELEGGFYFFSILNFYAISSIVPDSFKKTCPALFPTKNMSKVQ